MAIKTKRIYDPPAPDDGFRLLTMRLWPRGVKKELVSVWEKELGPSRELLGDFNQDRIDWETFRTRYLEEMAGKRELLEKWAGRARHEDITLLCGCKDENRCHRSLLKELLEQVARA